MAFHVFGDVSADRLRGGDIGGGASRVALVSMRKATAGVVDEVRKRVGGDLVDRVLAEVGKAGG